MSSINGVLLHCTIAQPRLCVQFQIPISEIQNLNNKGVAGWQFFKTNLLTCINSVALSHNREVACAAVCGPFAATGQSSAMVITDMRWQLEMNIASRSEIANRTATKKELEEMRRP